MLPPSLPPPGFGARGRAVRPPLFVVPRAERAAVPRFAAVVLRAVVERLVVPDARLAEPLVLLAAPADLARVVRFLVPVDAALAVRAFGRALVVRVPVDELRPPLLESLSSPVQLPDIIRCAASATASAIRVPSLDALDTTLLAACWAESAASIPASRILRRAAGLALIAAAAAASPAASISLLIAALAILSMVLSLDVDLGFEEPVERFALVRLLDLAIAILPSVMLKDTSEP